MVAFARQDDSDDNRRRIANYNAGAAMLDHYLYGSLVGEILADEDISTSGQPNCGLNDHEDAIRDVVQRANKIKDSDIP